MLKKQSICFGRKPVLEALESGRDLERIFLKKGLRGEAVSRIESGAKEAGVPVNFVPREKLQRLTNLNHQGVVAILSPVTYYKVQDVVDRCFADGRDPLLLILDGVTDVGNFGAICRTALGMEADAVVIGHYGSAPVNEQAIKASAGAIHHLRICRHKDLRRTIDTIQALGIRTVALDGSGESLLPGADLKGPLALIAGSEGKGVDRRLLESADLILRLPMAGVLESYNVSVATAMALYEIRRQRSS